MCSRNYRKMFVFILIVIACLHHASSESCYYQRCLGCRAENTYYTGTPTECDPGNWVTAEWVHNLGHPPPSTASKLPTEMRCLKMVATPDDTTLGRTVDVLKGCVPRAQVDSVCLALVAVERARGHSDARCFVCRGNNCNPAWLLKSTLFNTLPSVTLILYYVLK